MKKAVNLKLRPMERTDVELFYRWNSEEFRGRWQGYHFVSISECVKRFDAGEFNDEKMQILVIDVGQPVGFFSINFVRIGLAEIGIALIVRMRQRGIAQKALQQALNYVFSNYPIERVEADTDVANEPAKKPLLNAGFKLEGVLRKFRFHHGAYHDVELYSILREEWSSQANVLKSNKGQNNELFPKQTRKNSIRGRAKKAI